MENDHACDWPWLKFENFSSGVYMVLFCVPVFCVLYSFNILTSTDLTIQLRSGDQLQVARYPVHTG